MCPIRSRATSAGWVPAESPSVPACRALACGRHACARQPLLAIQPVHLLQVMPLPSRRSRDRQPSVAEPSTLVRNLAQPLATASSFPRSGSYCHADRLTPTSLQHDAPRNRDRPSSSPPQRSAPQAALVFSQQILQRRHVKHRLRQQLLQARSLAKPRPQGRHHHYADRIAHPCRHIRRLPLVKRRALTPCFRHTSAVDEPASCSRRIPMICSSVNLLRSSPSSLIETLPQTGGVSG